VSTEEAAAALRGVHRISNMAKTTRKHVELASGMLSLIPDSALAVEADDGTGKAGLAASCSEAGLAAPDTDAGMTARDPGSVSTLRKRCANTLLGWDVISKATELRGERSITTAGVARAMEVLHFWERCLASTTCVPETFPTEVDVAAQQLQQQLQEHTSSTVDKAKLALEEALPKLEEVVFGKRGGSWEDKLTEASPWDDVLSEATCHLLGGKQGAIADTDTAL